MSNIFSVLRRRHRLEPQPGDLHLPQRQPRVLSHSFCNEFKIQKGKKVKLCLIYLNSERCYQTGCQCTLVFHDEWINSCYVDLMVLIKSLWADYSRVGVKFLGLLWNVFVCTLGRTLINCNKCPVTFTFSPKCYRGKLQNYLFCDWSKRSKHQGIQPLEVQQFTNFPYIHIYHASSDICTKLHIQDLIKYCMCIWGDSPYVWTILRKNGNG